MLYWVSIVVGFIYALRLTTSLGSVGMMKLVKLLGQCIVAVSSHKSYDADLRLMFS